MTENPIELTEDDIQIDWWRFEKLDDKISGGVKGTSQKYYQLIIQSHKPNIEIAKQLKKQILQALQEYPKLKAENEKLKIAVSAEHNNGLRLFEENNQLRQLKERLEKRIEELENSPDYETGYALEELQKLLKPEDEE